VWFDRRAEVREKDTKKKDRMGGAIARIAHEAPVGTAESRQKGLGTKGEVHVLPSRQRKGSGSIHSA